MKAKAHKLFGGKKGEHVQPNGDPSEHGEDLLEGDKQNGIDPHVGVFFKDGVGTQVAANGNYCEEDVDDENDEVRISSFCMLVTYVPVCNVF